RPEGAVVEQGPQRAGRRQDACGPWAKRGPAPKENAAMERRGARTLFAKGCPRLAKSADLTVDAPRGAPSPSCHGREKEDRRCRRLDKQHGRRSVGCLTNESEVSSRAALRAVVPAQQARVSIRS